MVPKGAVAAGIEVADTDDTTTMAAGAGLLAIFAVLGAGTLRRRRNHS
ncbi:MYXO-CTERM sorting domain-containing protein [Streptomyces sp. H34-S4]|nr:MYXO-CTERM sorting domain-containing protein [Streptomyces sp. H34-S4]MCY0935147.1 MYXO-CTERM sorting domain-containing protein [Streptomyces sp. H34-S4]